MNSRDLPAIYRAKNMLFGFCGVTLALATCGLVVRKLAQYYGVLPTYFRLNEYLANGWMIVVTSILAFSCLAFYEHNVSVSAYSAQDDADESDWSVPVMVAMFVIFILALFWNFQYYARNIWFS